MNLELLLPKLPLIEQRLIVAALDELQEEVDALKRLQAVNPSGSRNIEPLPPKPFIPAVPPWAPPGTKAVVPEFK